LECVHIDFIGAAKAAKKEKKESIIIGVGLLLGAYGTNKEKEEKKKDKGNRIRRTKKDGFQIIQENTRIKSKSIYFSSKSCFI